MEPEQFAITAQAGGLGSSGNLDHALKLYFTEIFLFGAASHVTSEYGQRGRLSS